MSLLSGSGACVLRLSAAGAWLSAACIRAGARLSSADAWVSSAGTRPWLAAWRFRWGPVTYCTQRYRSYNPQTGTYLGNDGQRHHCP
jgi:hypothetical protein